MKIILTTSLFFCLTLTTILAQVVTTNIATPVAGLSTNSVADFDVNSDGTILNNSAASGTATLGSTAVAANNNITAGSEASLILLQVTGTSGSDLDGTIEVFGGGAGLIIANPNGITCDGCGFINVNRVDLVTGSGYDAGTNTFSTIATTDITIEGDALELSNVDLNIQTGRDFSNDVAINADSLTVIAGADFKNAGAIVAETVTIEVIDFSDDIANTGTVSSDNLNFILTDDFSTSATSFNGFNFRNLALTAEGRFSNRSVLDLDNLTVKTGGTFANNTDITADNFTATVGTHLLNNGATINVNSFTITVGEEFNNGNGSVINVDSFTVTARNFYNSNISAAANTTINATNLTVTVAENFGTFNGSVINAASFTVTAKNFNTNAGTTIDAATVTIEVANFASNISNAGTISSDSLNFILTADFTHTSDSFTNFNNFSNLAITTDGTFTNNNAIDLAGNITITANTFINYNSVTAADNLSVVVSNHFNNSASTLKADNVDIQVTNYILNSSNAMIEATDNLNIVTGTLFNVAAGAKLINGNVGGNIIAANLTIETDKFNNINNDGDINGNISANTFALSVAEDFDYANRGTITTNNAFNLNVGGDFSYDDSASDFTWGATDTLTVLGNVNITTNNYTQSGTITVDGVWTINALTDFTYSNANNDFIWDTNDSLVVSGNAEITTNNFANGGTISANTLALSVAGDFDYIADYLNNGSITTNAFNLQVGGDFSYNDSANDFTWGEPIHLQFQGMLILLRIITLNLVL